MNDGTASGQQRMLFPVAEDETVVHTSDGHDSVAAKLMEHALRRENMQRALRQVRSNKGGPGCDGLTVERLPDFLRLH